MNLIRKGPITSKILLVGEAPGEEEAKKGIPFIGQSGKELDKILSEAGLDPAGIRFTNVCHVRPPKNDIGTFIGFSKKDASKRSDLTFDAGEYFTPEIAQGLQYLRSEIESMPNLEMIIPVGNVPLWATTGQWGITKWRGSQLFAKRLSRPIPTVPTYHPAAILRMWDWRWVSVLDMQRAKKWQAQTFSTPKYEFITRPSFASTVDFLSELKDQLDAGKSLKISTDLETRSKYTSCLGIATSSLRAICIPFFTTFGPYWNVEEEIRIIWLLYQILTHPKCEVIGQNYNYDRQYIARRWGFRSRLTHDTMFKQHVCFPGIPKGLDFISSLHCNFHAYWKDESKDWDPHIGEEQLWIYNCKDAVSTFESNDSLDKVVKAFDKESQLAEMMWMNEQALTTMLRGMRTDTTRKANIADSLEKAMIHLLRYINRCVGIDLQDLPHLDDYDSKKMKILMPSSPKSIHSLCYDVLKLQSKFKVTENGRVLTADKDAIKEWLATADPIYRPVLQAIMDFRSLQVFRSTFALADLDSDSRWRCSINVAGPNTFRFSTSEDAFGFGSNMQNISEGTEE